jgi:hypothetical protein
MQGPPSYVSTRSLDDGENSIVRIGEIVRGAIATGDQAFAYGGPRFDSLNYFYGKIDLGQGAFYYDF